MEKGQVTIELECDGWVVNINNRRYAWNHNETDLGTKALAVLFKDLGYNVDIQEIY